MLDKNAIQTDQAPAALGPYSQGVRAGDTLYVSGQVPLDAATGAIVSGGITEQTTQVTKNIAGILSAAGLSASNVVKTTVFLKDIGDFAAMNEVYAKFFAAEGNIPPARSTVEVARLPKDVLIEIEVIARG
jgi:2-iminobutanoate/2-iminopropanoate deaminase